LFSAVSLADLGVWDQVVDLHIFNPLWIALSYLLCCRDGTVFSAVSLADLKQPEALYRKACADNQHVLLVLLLLVVH
jgi:hypothetical protein